MAHNPCKESDGAQPKKKNNNVNNEENMGPTLVFTSVGQIQHATNGKQGGGSPRFENVEQTPNIPTIYLH